MQDVYVDPESLLLEESQMYDTSTERAFLSSIMKDNEGMHEAVSQISPNDIFNEHNNLIYRTMIYMYNRQQKTGCQSSYDHMSLIGAADDTGKRESFLTKAGGIEHLELVESCPTKKASFPYYMKRILQVSYRVKAFRAARKTQISCLNATREDVSDIVSSVEASIMSVSANRHDRAIVSLGSSVDTFLKTCEDRKDKDDVLGVAPKFCPQLMRVLNSFRRRTLTVLFARPKTGKSAFFLNVALDLACGQGIPVLYIDTEMSQEEQLSRALSKWSGVPEWDILSGKFANDPDAKRAIDAILDAFRDAPFHYSAARGISTEELVSRCRQFKAQFVGDEMVNGEKKTKPALIIYDWLKVGNDDFGKFSKEHQELGRICSAIKDVGAELDIPIVAGAQANRTATGAGNSDAYKAENCLADSDRILRFCNTLVWLRKVSNDEMSEILQYDNEYFYNQKIHVLDSRGGPTCVEGIPLHFYPEMLHYEEKHNIPEDALPRATEEDDDDGPGRDIFQ
jgi:replicative DNA helicase